MSGSCQCRPDNDLAHRPLYWVGSSLNARRRRATASSRPSNHSHPPDSSHRRLALGESSDFRMAGSVERAALLKGWTQSQRPCSIAVGLSPPSWSASFTACDSIPAALKDVSLSSTGSSFWSPYTPRRPLASDFYGGVVTLTSEVWTSGYSRLRLSGQNGALANGRAQKIVGLCPSAPGTPNPQGLIRLSVPLIVGPRHPKPIFQSILFIRTAPVGNYKLAGSIQIIHYVVHQ